MPCIRPCYQVGGNQRGGRVPLGPEIESQIAHSIKMGELKDGETAYLVFGGDGTQVTRRETCTAHTIKLANDRKALSIGTISIVTGPENYQVNLLTFF